MITGIFFAYDKNQKIKAFIDKIVELAQHPDPNAALTLLEQAYQARFHCPKTRAFLRATAAVFLIVAIVAILCFIPPVAAGLSITVGGAELAGIVGCSASASLFTGVPTFFDRCWGIGGENTERLIEVASHDPGSEYAPMVQTVGS